MTQAVLSEEEVNAMVAHGVGFIYAITSTISGKKYIGKANDYRIRWEQHKQALNNGTHYNKHLQRAWGSYGENSFTFEIIAVVRRSMLNDAERHYIATYESHNPQYGYNKTMGGDGCIPTEEIRAKISETLTGHKHTEETKQRMSESHAGEKSWRAKLTNEQAREIYLNTNSKLSTLAEHYGVCRHTIRHIQGGDRFATVTEGLPMHPRHKARLEGAGKYVTWRKIAQYTKEGILIKIWDSAMQAEREGGFCSKGINRCCNGKLKTHKKFKWKYITHEETAG